MFRRRILAMKPPSQFCLGTNLLARILSGTFLGMHSIRRAVHSPFSENGYVPIWREGYPDSVEAYRMKKGVMYSFVYTCTTKWCTVHYINYSQRCIMCSVDLTRARDPRRRDCIGGCNDHARMSGVDSIPHTLSAENRSLP